MNLRSQLVHSRFSTNTNPSWERAHPNRFIVHNGEINTIKGNADKMLAREETMESEFLKGELQKVLPVVNTEGSDSAMLRQYTGIPCHERHGSSTRCHDLTIPEPWANNKPHVPEEKRFLPVLRNNDGAVGRTCIHSFLRW